MHFHYKAILACLETAVKVPMLTKPVMSCHLCMLYRTLELSGRRGRAWTEQRAPGGMAGYLCAWVWCICYVIDIPRYPEGYHAIYSGFFSHAGDVQKEASRLRQGKPRGTVRAHIDIRQVQVPFVPYVMTC
jgi:hypothetical protein